MMQRAALGAVVGVIAVLVLSMMGGLTLPAPPAAHASGIHSSVAPSASPPPNPFFTGMAASVALGAYNLSSNWGATPPNASTFIPDPELSCSGPNGTLWVPDYDGARVLEFKSPFTTGENASVVIGQSTFSGSGTGVTATNFTTVGACTTDSHGDLWVSDDQNSRVLEFVPPFTNGKAASLVLGQAGFTTGSAGTTATSLSGPVGLSFDSQGDLWVADSGNNRVLEFVPPFADGMRASLVLGQTSFLSASSGTTASNFSFPLDVAASAGVVWVADGSNERVLGFTAPFSTGEGATYLLGQTSFVNAGLNTGAGAFNVPSSVAVDTQGNLWVTSSDGNRVLEFLPPFTTDENATVAIGQKNLTATTANTTASTLNFPLGAVVAPSGAIWVTDAGNSRVLEYIPSTYHVTFAAAGLPAAINLTVTVSGASSHGPGPNVTVTAENGSYVWSVSPIPGYQFSPTSGSYLVNGHNVIVTLTVTHLTYSVTFTALGLPGGTNWSVTLGGVIHNSPNNGTIVFTETNGTYAYTASTVSGYNITPRSGSVVVGGTSQGVSIGFAAIPSTASSSSSSPYGGGVGLLLIVVAAVVGLLVGLLIGRRRKGGATTVAPAATWTPPPSAATPPPPMPPPPPSAGGPPPGAMG